MSSLGINYTFWPKELSLQPIVTGGVQVEQPETKWLTVAEVSKALGIGNRTLYAIIDRDELTAYKFGRIIRIKEVDLFRYMREARIRPGELDHLYPDRKNS